MIAFTITSDRNRAHGISTKEKVVMAGRHIHPGLILLEKYLKPLGISQYALARHGRAAAAHQ